MNKARGFTLIELIIVIVLTGILAGTVTVFFKPAVDSYLASQRRAILSDMADTTLRRMVREVRLAVPNSVLEHPGNQCIEFVPTKAGGRYRMAPHVNDDGSSQENTGVNCPDTGRSCTLDLTESPMKNAFDVLQLSQSATPVAGDFVVIGNQELAQVYGGSNRKLLASFVALPAPASFGTHRIGMGAGDLSSVYGYESGRFSVVPASGSVAFVCQGAGVSGGNGVGRLFRVNRALGTGVPGSCPDTTGAPVLASRVSHCRFVYSSNGGTQQNGLVWMEVTLMEDGEPVSLAFAAHVSNVP